MTESNSRKQDARELGEVHPLPDPDRCGARLYAPPDTVECMAKRPSWCQFVLRYGDRVFCAHPLRLNIVARTKGG